MTTHKLNWFDYCTSNNLASNPCELNCVPRGENFYYRHRPAVVDGTPCYVGRTDICVDGVCRVGAKTEILQTSYQRHIYSVTVWFHIHSRAPILSPLWFYNPHFLAKYIYHWVGLFKGVIYIFVVFQMLTHGEFRGLDADTNSVYSVAPVAVAPHPSETLTYTYKTGVYGACSATCNGGMQYRSVECWAQDPVNPRAVEETYCITQRLQRPQSQQACNMQPCAAAEYSVSSFSMVCILQQRISNV